MTETPWQFDHLQMFGYDFIMADPPWRFENWSKAGEDKNASAKYDCMDLEDIKALPVDLLARGDCLLWLWACNPMLDQAFDVLKAWKFEFKTAGTWVKMTSKGNQAFGTGYLLRSANEPFLIGTIGNPKTAKNTRSAIIGPVREHSRKPDEAFAAAENMMPMATRLELFSRQPRAGWETWGDEVHKFEEVIDDCIEELGGNHAI